MSVSVAIVGATGMVGQEMLKVLQEINFPVKELLPVASERSIGKSISFKDESFSVMSMQTAIAKKPDIALFSAGGAISLEWAPKFAEAGIRVIDNSSAWRMDPEIKLVVPEINGNTLNERDMIIANPNCSTIQLVMTLNPLHQKYKVKRVVVSTYQSITGTGQAAVSQWEAEKSGEEKYDMVYPYPIDKNCLPHCDIFLENDYTKEEMKLVNETCKIIGDDNIRLTATAVRVPVVGGHSEAVNVEFENEADVQEVRQILSQTPGVTVQDQPELNKYPMPIYAKGKNDVFVGRIRRDETQPNTLNMWIVSDNLRKGAATNAIQIAQRLQEKGLIGV